MSQPLGVAVVGLGLAGSVMTEAIKSHPGVRLAAAAETRPELRRRFSAAEGLPAYEHLDQLLDRDDVDVVYLATPHELHATQAARVASAGRHVIVEKPMALSVGECDAMIAAADRFGVVVVVGHTHGFDPGIARLSQLVRDGRYGEVGLVSMWNYTSFLYRPRRRAELDPALGGGVVLNQVAHQVDVVRTILGRRVRSVRALTTRLDPDRPVDGSCAVLLQFDGGVGASLVYSGYDHFDSDEFHGWVTEGGLPGGPRHARARGRLAGLGYAESEERSVALGYGARPVAAPVHQPHFGEIVVTCAHADLRLGPDAVIAYGDEGLSCEPIAGAPWVPGHGDVLTELVDAVRAGTRPVHDGRFGRETVRVCEAITESAVRGADVSLALVEEGV